MNSIEIRRGGRYYVSDQNVGSHHFAEGTTVTVTVVSRAGDRYQCSGVGPNGRRILQWLAAEDLTTYSTEPDWYTEAHLLPKVPSDVLHAVRANAERTYNFAGGHKTADRMRRVMRLIDEELQSRLS
jgi:hypothetical protein